MLPNGLGLSGGALKKHAFAIYARVLGAGSKIPECKKRQRQEECTAQNAQVHSTLMVAPALGREILLANKHAEEVPGPKGVVAP